MARIAARAMRVLELVLVGPAAARAGGWLVGGQNNWRRRRPGRPDGPRFRMEAPARKGKKGFAGGVEVLRNGVAVGPCGALLGSAAAPDPCWSVNRYDAATNDHVVSVGLEFVHCSIGARPVEHAVFTYGSAVSKHLGRQ